MNMVFTASLQQRAVLAGKSAEEEELEHELVKPFNEIQLVQVQPGQSRSGQAGSECCQAWRTLRQEHQWDQRGSWQFITGVKNLQLELPAFMTH